MRFPVRMMIYIFLCMGVGYASMRSYQYFFDRQEPVCHISGVEDSGQYKGDIACVIDGHDDFGVAHISIWLDGKSLIDKFAIRADTFEYPFSIPTKTLPNGTHELRFEVVDSTYHHNKYTQTIPFIVDNVPLQAALVKPVSEYKLFQGRTMHVQFQVNKPITSAVIHTTSGSFACFPESKTALIYESFIPIDCQETPNEYLLTAKIEDAVGNTVTLEKKFQVVMYPFKQQTIQVDPQTVQQEKEMGLSQDKLEQDVAQLAQHSLREKLWQGSFIAPIEIQRVTTEFGVIRTTQERGRYMHKAVDVINVPKSVIWAPQDGKVILKDRYAFSGNTVVLDHGYGIFTLLYHLEDFADIKIGDLVRQGNPVGRLGKTGYAKGYHLHWEMRIDNVAIDPLQWIKPDF